MLAGVAAAVVAAAAVAVVLGGSPPPATPPPDIDGQLRWVAKLVDASPRGSLAADASFTRELADRVGQAVSTFGLVFFSSNTGTPRRLSTRVLFADDIDNYRVVLLSLRNDEITDDRRRYALTYVLWLYGPRGATPEALTRTISVSATREAAYRLDPATPVVSALIGAADDPLWVVLAPPECDLATAPASNLTDWTPDTTGYLAHRLRADGPLYWRATCQGVVREIGPAPRPAITDRDVDRLMASAEGHPDRRWLGSQASQLAGTYGSELVNLGRVLWSGNVALSAHATLPAAPFALVQVGDGVAEVVDVPVDTTVTVLVAPRARGGWIGSVSTVVRTSPDEEWGIDDTTFAAPDNPHGLIAVRLDRWNGQVLVLARSPEVARVRIVDGDGRVLDEAPVDGSSGDHPPVMLAPDRNAPHDGLHVAALDVTGKTLTTVELADTRVSLDRVTVWS